jgi:hypothetical protein
LAVAWRLAPSIKSASLLETGDVNVTSLVIIPRPRYPNGV